MLHPDAEPLTIVTLSFMNYALRFGKKARDIEVTVFETEQFVMLTFNPAQCAATLVLTRYIMCQILYTHMADLSTGDKDGK